jgi:hypothetical protein
MRDAEVEAPGTIARGTLPSTRSTNSAESATASDDSSGTP